MLRGVPARAGVPRGPQGQADAGSIRGAVERVGQPGHPLRHADAYRHVENARRHVGNAG